MRRHWITLLALYCSHLSVAYALQPPRLNAFNSPIKAAKHLNLEQVFQHSKTSKLDLALQDYTAVAGSFFGGVRIPASLIAGA